MRTSYGYDTYRGRTALQRVLTAIIVLLLIVLLLAVGAFFFLQRYIVYTDDGQARLDLPFFASPTPEGAPTPTQTQPMVVVTPEPADTPQPTPAPVAAIKPVSLFRAALTEGSTQRLVERAGGDAALFNMRANDGSLGYVSALPLAAQVRSSAASAKLEGQILAVTDTELYTAARVSCFKDNLLSRAQPELAIKTVSGYNWRDGSDSRWLDPANAQARQYAAGICGELAALGFDEIVLDHAGYPTTGNLAQIQDLPDAAAQAKTLEQFYQSVRDAIGDDVALAIAVNAQALEEGGDGSGVTAQLLGKYAQRVYILGCDTPGKYDQVLADEGLGQGAVVYVEAACDDLSPTGRLVNP